MVYTYDTWGNLATKKIYAYTTATNPGTPTSTITYGYGNSAWKDQLTSYNGQTIAYDAMGNPTTYRGKTLTWRGKQLTGVTGTATYVYDSNGLRQRKTVSGTNTDYCYNGSVLIGLTKGSDKLRFSYDAAGQVQAVDFNGTYYYYLRNGQGDIVKIIDSSGAAKVEYTYDSWGKKLSCTGTLATTLGALNPFRYRGYVYDEETQWYYLKSRYYDPETCRFISADVLLSTGQGVLGHNCYAYCLNNPSVLRDDEGTVAIITYCVVESKTELFKTSAGEKFVTTITYDLIISGTEACYTHSYRSTVSLEFTIDEQGIVHVDNNQPNMKMIMNRTIGNTFANEIMKSARGMHKSYLAGRTASGIRFELLVHYLAHLMKPSQKNAASADIGSSKSFAGYDDNAAAFEKPIRNWKKWIKMIQQMFN